MKQVKRKGQTLYDSTYMRPLEDSDSERQRQDVVAGAGEGTGSQGPMGAISVGEDE